MTTYEAATPESEIKTAIWLINQNQPNTAVMYLHSALKLLSGTGQGGYFVPTVETDPRLKDEWRSDGEGA